MNQKETYKMNRNLNITRHLCLLPGIFLIVSGILLLFFPDLSQALFDFPGKTISKEPIAHALGVRQLAIGLMIVALSVSRQTKALGFVMVIGAIVPMADFLIFQPVIGTVSAMRHFAPVPFIFGLGVYLLAKSRNK
ncbi:MAG: DUF4267 domain-containing protein [Lewinellaceae bacterium]|nr:DUF4267 domain-containing protein [Lewinellaceae bacterium]